MTIALLSEAQLLHAADDVDEELLPPAPAELGAAFITALNYAARLTREANDEIEHTLGLQVSAWDVANMSVDMAIDDAGLSGSCQFTQPGEPAEAGPYIEAIEDQVGAVAAYMLNAVLARDYGLITEENFNIVTAPWTAAGLPLPDPRDGYAFAADDEAVGVAARHLRDHRYRTDGWPLAVVTA